MSFKEMLEKKEKTMFQIAKETGLGVATVHEIVTGKRKGVRVETALKISDALGIDIREFIEVLRGGQA